ncbi:cell envelope integrity protein CreD [Duganella aceris]|uniref:Cell envelope integrity protein CreD n=1 Tax=Duganella aceris TaxID=2703883 RepID=A0ABX0FEN3_9BURK|nr:cell envelope integrity protein CreD [Duganella aceris]NGZ82999.1 cell envelope integrity protein CreD [Duganella aceris]
MQKKLLYKILAIAALTLLLGIALALIQSTIDERLRFRDQAVQSVANDSVREQVVVGPVLVIPYSEAIEARDDAEAKGKSGARTVKRRKLVYPNTLQVNGAITTDRRYRGIHQVLIYSGRHNFAGDFTLPQLADLPRESATSRLTLGLPYVALAVSDVRGIRDIPRLNWGGRELEFQQGAALPGYASGMHAPLEQADLKEGAKVAFSFALGLAGIENQHFVPVARNNRYVIQSNWPHPQFAGDFLPESRSVGDAGFNAEWRISSMASRAQQQLDALAAGERVKSVDSFHIGFIEPVNIYSQASRATKYGLLFVALTFAAFFVFEVVKRLAIHPIQYLLVGLALALFFLLLVGLSEHIPFVAAYGIAASACIALIAYYLGHALHSRWRGLGFGVGLVLLYSALYGLLISENNALVLGSLLLFAVLAALMVATRQVDWYEIGNSEQAETSAGPQP